MFFVCLQNNYANVDLIVKVAVEQGVDGMLYYSLDKIPQFSAYDF